MMHIPAIAILVGYLISKLRPKVLGIVSSIAVGVVTLVFAFTMPITLKDGLEGLSARKPDRSAITIETDFKETYDYGFVAFDDFGRSASPVDLGIPMNKMIYVGNHPYWDNLLEHPNEVARFIIMQPDDRLWESLHDDKQFQEDYSLLAVRNKTYLYKCTNNCTTNYR